jgi:response regulator RpfG family c-di-GMP phosphodiesterase
MYLPRGEVVGASRPVFEQSSSRGLVLLVEDEPRVRAQARRLLQRAGYDVIEASDGAQGSRIFAERQRRRRRSSSPTS